MAIPRNIQDSEIPATVEQIRRERWNQLLLISALDDLEHIQFPCVRSHSAEQLTNAIAVFPSQISAILAGLVHSDFLVMLDLRGFELSPSELTEFLQLAQTGHFKNLVQLQLSSNCLNAKAGTALARSLQAGHIVGLTHLDLWSNRLGAEGCVALAHALQAGNLNGLKHLDLSWNDVGATGGAALARALESGHLSSLTQLDLSNNNLLAQGGAALARAVESGHLHSLTQLNLSENSLWPEGGAALARALASGYLPSLTQLNLSRNSLGAEGGAALARALASGCLPSLTQLNLSGNSLGAEGGAALARALESGHLHSLTRLNLSANSLGAEGGAALARALASDHLPSLTQIDLGYNRLGAEVGAAMARAIHDGKLPNLQSLGLSVNELGVEEEFLGRASPPQIAEAILHGQTLNEVRILFVGTGEVGKTWLAERCFEDYLIPKDRVRHETTDFNLVPPERCHFKPVLSLSGRSQVLIPRVWDFAGQMVTHGVHETFLSDRPGQERTISILVLSAKRAVGSRRDLYSGEEIGNNLPYWLKTLANHASPRAPVIVAISQCDGLTVGNRAVDQTDGLPKRLIDFSPQDLGQQFHVNVTAIIDRCSAVTTDVDGNPPVDRCIEPLRTAINEATQQLVPALLAKVSPQFRRLRRSIEGHLRGRNRSAIDEFSRYISGELLLAGDSSRHLIEIADFRSWCQQAGLTDSGDQDASLRILDQMGVVFFFGRTSNEEQHGQEVRIEHFDAQPVGRRRQEVSEPDTLLQRYVINPHWLKNVVYQVIRKSETTPLFRLADLKSQISEANRSFDLSSSGEVTADEVGVIKAFLKWTELCLDQKQDGSYFFPRGCDRGEADTEGWDMTTLRWNYLPESAFHRFCVKMMRQDQSNGRDGLHIAAVNGRRQQWRLCIVLRQGDSKLAVTARPEDDLLELAVAPYSDCKVAESLKGKVKVLMEDILGFPPTEDVDSRGTAWFEDLPLDFQRDETREVLRLLGTGYRTPKAVLALAEDAGLDVMLLDHRDEVRLLIRDVMKTARQADRLPQLIGEVIADKGQAAIHQRLAQLMMTT